MKDNPLIKLFFVVLIFLLLGTLIHYCNPESQIQSVKSDTVVRVVTHTDTFYHNSNYYHYDTIKTEIPVYVDTTQVVTDYYTYKAIEDSFSGKNYHIKLYDTLYMNSLYARRATISVTQVDSIITNTITIKDKPKIKGYIGLSYSTNTGLDRNYLFVNGGLQTKRENIWILGYDPFNKQIQAGFLYKLKLK